MSAERAEFVAHLLCPGCGEIVALIPGLLDQDDMALCDDCCDREGDAGLLDIEWASYREVVDVPPGAVL